jgi:hypothetical protein
MSRQGQAAAAATITTNESVSDRVQIKQPLSSSRLLIAVPLRPSQFSSLGMNLMNTRTSPSKEDSLDQICDQIATHDSQRLGWFRFHFGDDRWTWSPQVEHMHGYHPGTTAPGTSLVLSHVHPDDERRVAAGLYDIRRTGDPFSSHHRIVDARHRLRDVVMIGVPFFDSQGALAGMQGFYLDATPATDRSGFVISADQLRDPAAEQRQRDGRHQRVRAATRC